MREWTKDDDVFLWKSYGKLKTKEIARVLNRSVASVQSRLYRVKEKSNEDKRVYSEWTDATDRVLREKFTEVPMEELVNRLNKSESVIRRRARTLGISMTKHRWTEEEYKYIREKWNTMGTDKIAEYIGVEEHTLIKRAHMFLGLNGKSVSMELWYDIPTLADMLGITKKSIYYYIQTGIITARRFKYGNTHRYRVNENNLREFIKKNPKYYNTFDGDMESIKGLFVDVKLMSDNELKVTDIPKWLHEKIEYDILSKDFKTGRKDWTMREVKEARRLEKEGLGAVAIGGKLGRSRNSVNAMLYKLRREGFGVCE